MSRKVNLFIYIGLAIVALAGGVYVALAPTNNMMNWYNIDDAFYYYKVAQNALTGHGFSFDQINLSNGYHPLWMLICLGVFWLSKYSLILPLRVLVIVSAMFNGLSSILLYRLLKRFIHPAAALTGALFTALSPAIYDTMIAHGMESSVSGFFIILFLSTAVKYLNRPDDNPKTYRELLWVGFIGVLTIFARLDNVFLVGIVGITLLLRIKRIPYFLVLDLIALVISTFLAWIFRLGSINVIMKTHSIYPMLAIAIFIKPVIFYFCGLYTTAKTKSRLSSIIQIAISSVISLIVEYLILFLLFKFNITLMFSKTLVVIDGGISFVLILIIHLFYKSTTDHAAGNPFILFGNWVKNNWKKYLFGGISFGAPIAVLLGAYMIWNQITFGTFMPVSGQVKSWWGTLSNSIYTRPRSLLGVLGLGNGGGDPWSIITAPVFRLAEKIGPQLQWKGQDLIFGFLLICILAIIFLIMRADKGRLAQKLVYFLIPSILGSSVLQITKYTATSYAAIRSWYWIAEIITLVIIGSVALDMLFTWVDRWKTKINFSWIIVGICAGFLIFSHAKYIITTVPPTVTEEYKEYYLSEIKELEFYTTPGSKIGMTGSGMAGYFVTDRTIINLDGLINSVEYFDAMKSGTGAEFLDELGLDYVFGKPYVLLESDPYASVFKDRAREIGYIRGFGGFSLFEYVGK